jgi:hypothetical protein
LNAAIDPPAVPSFAATTPSILSPKRVICPATQSCALGGAQSGVSNSASSFRPLGSIALCMPFLIRPAAASVGDPLTWRSPPFGLSSLTLSTSDWANISPSFSLSNET